MFYHLYVNFITVINYGDADSNNNNNNLMLHSSEYYCIRSRTSEWYSNIFTAPPN